MDTRGGAVDLVDEVDNKHILSTTSTQSTMSTTRDRVSTTERATV